MTRLPPAQDGQVRLLEAKAATLSSGNRTFIVLTLPQEAISIVFEWKAPRGFRPGAYISRRISPPLEPGPAVSGLLFGIPEADALEVADREIQSYRNAWTDQSRECARLRKQVRGLLKTKKNRSGRSDRVKRTLGKGG